MRKITNASKIENTLNKFVKTIILCNRVFVLAKWVLSDKVIRMLYFTIEVNCL